MTEQTTTTTDAGTTTAPPADQTPANTQPEGSNTSTDNANANGAANTDPDTIDENKPMLGGDDEQTEGQDANAGEGDKEGDDKDVAPEQYEFQKPEGVEIAEPVIDAFSKVAKDLNLSQDAAQKLMDEVAPAIAQHQNEALKQQIKAWQDELRSDPEFGGDKLQENLGIANKAFKQFFSDAERAEINRSGLGDWAPLVRAMHRVGKAMSQDNFVVGDGTAKHKRRPFAQQVYGD